MLRTMSVLLAAFLLGTASLFAQTTTGTLRGTVRDTSGAVLPGATVEVTGAAGTQTTVADTNGLYRFQALTPGVYTLKATLDGFKAIVMEGLQVEVGRTFDVDLHFEVGAVAETITVRGESPLIDTSQSSVTVNYNQELIQDTPVLRFSVFDYFQMTPGIASTQVQDSTTSSAFGSNTNENQYQIDGTNITSPTAGQMWPYPNTDIVAAMELVGVGAPAEYGNMQGAVFNIVTKSGGNAMKGLLNWFSQYQATTGNNQPDEEFPYHREKFQDATVQLGGPVSRDKMWWFGSYQYRRDFSSEPGTDPAFPTQDLQDRVFGKLTWQVNQNNNLLFAYHNDHWRLPDTITPTLPHDAASMGRGHNPTVTATWRRVLNDSTTFDLRYGGFYNWSSGRGLTEDLITPGVYDEIRDEYSVNARDYTWSNLAPYTTGISARVSRFLTLGGRQHDVRFGLQFTDGGTQSESVWPGGRQVTLRDGAPGYIDVRDPSISGGHVRAFGVYADDSWAMTDRITLNAGLRFDLNTGDIPEMPILDAARDEVGTSEASRILSTGRRFRRGSASTSSCANPAPSCARATAATIRARRRTCSRRCRRHRR